MGDTNWYLREWMEECGLVGRGAQARMMVLTGWSRATMSQLYNGTQDYSPKIINEAAGALKIKPHELLIHPAEAIGMRELRKAAFAIVGGEVPPAGPIRLV